MHNIKNIVYVLVFFISIFIFNPLVHAYTTYSVGEEVEYNGIKFYVIKDSGANEEKVTLLKAEPLTVNEVNLYGGVGTSNNHVNVYNVSSNYSHFQTAYNSNGYGGMSYYTSVNCGWGTGSNQTSLGCTTDYAQSEIKYVVDAWKNAQVPSALEARLITIDEVSNLGYEWYDNGSLRFWKITENVPTWLYNEKYWYWTSSQYADSSINIWYVNSDGSIDDNGGVDYHDFSYSGTVRPVITLKKTALGDIEENINDNDNQKEEKTEDSVNDKDSINEDVSVIVSVPNTLQKISIVLIMIGITFLSISIVILVKKRK